MSSAVENHETTPTVARRGRPRRQYKCGFCAKPFKRSEHCIRHERTHTHEKPFVCRYCSKPYSRKDLVTRHERTLHAKAHEERLQKDRDQDLHLDTICVQVNTACNTLSQSIALVTPPGDEVDDCLDLNISNKNSPWPRNPLSPGQENAPSLSSPSSFSSHSTAFHASHGQTTKSGVTTTTGRKHPRSPPAWSSITDSLPYDPALESRVDPEHHTSNSEMFDSHIGDRSLEITNTDNITTDMSMDTDNQLAAIIGEISSARQECIQQPLQPLGSMELDSTQFPFSPIPSFDIDLSVFPFSPLPNNSHENTNTRPFLSVGDGFAPPDLPTETSQTSLDLNNTSLHQLPRFEASDGTVDGQNTVKSSGGYGLPLLQDKRQTYLPVTLDDSDYEAIRNDLASRQTTADADIDLPPAKLCQRFLSSYITSFHGHLPIIHIQSFSPGTTPSPLVLAMCSIGALYRLERRRARRLYDMAIRSVEIVARPLKNRDRYLVKDYCLWYAQARMLLSFYAIMSGDQGLIHGTMNDNGFYTLVYNKARAALEVNSTDMSRTTWHQWIEYESWKRLLGGLFVASTLTMVLFDVNPGFNATQDLEFEALHDEAMWDAKSADEWRQLRTHILSKCQGQKRRTMKDVLVDIMLEGRYQSDTAPYQVSAFSALVLIHGVVVQMWQRLQVSHAMLSIKGSDILGSSLIDSAMKTLARCEAFLMSTGFELGTLEAEGDEETSLVYSAQAILRIAYIRLFKTIGPSCRISLLSTDPAEMDEALVSFIANEIDRSPQLLNAVTKSFEGLRIPVKLGAMLVCKTAAFKWSVAHAIAGWESALLVTRWIHSVEIGSLNGTAPSPEEQKFLALVRDVLEEAECDLGENSSLAAGAARTWSRFLHDVWIWGITPRMGVALELLAKAYETARFSTSNRL